MKGIKKVSQFLVAALCCHLNLAAMEDEKTLSSKDQIDQQQTQECSYIEAVNRNDKFINSLENSNNSNNILNGEPIGNINSCPPILQTLLSQVTLNNKTLSKKNQKYSYVEKVSKDDIINSLENSNNSNNILNGKPIGNINSCPPILQTLLSQVTTNNKMLFNQNQINQQQTQECSYFDDIDNNYDFSDSLYDEQIDIQDLNGARTFSKSTQEMLNSTSALRDVMGNVLIKKAVGVNFLCPPKLLPLFKRVTYNSYKPVVMMYPVDSDFELVTNYFKDKEVGRYFIYKFLMEYKPQPTGYTESPSSVDSLLRINSKSENIRALSDAEAKDLGIKPSNLEIVLDLLSSTSNEDLMNIYAGTILIIKSNKANKVSTVNLITNRIKKFALQMFINSCEQLDKSSEEYKEFVTSELIEILLFKCLCNAINSADYNNSKISKSELLSRFDYVFADVRTAFASVTIPRDFRTVIELLDELYKKENFISKDDFAKYDEKLRNLEKQSDLTNKPAKKENNENQSVWDKVKKYLGMEEIINDEYERNYLKRQCDKKSHKEYRWITVINN